MKFYITYVLFSERDKQLYIGYTANLERRIEQHQNGEVLSTSSRRPLKLIYYEAHLLKATALRRERYFKTSSGRRTLKIILKETLEDLDRSET
jgi:putative endonuclease